MYNIVMMIDVRCVMSVAILVMKPICSYAMVVAYGSHMHCHPTSPTSSSSPAAVGGLLL